MMTRMESSNGTINGLNPERGDGVEGAEGGATRSQTLATGCAGAEPRLTMRSGSHGDGPGRGRPPAWAVAWREDFLWFEKLMLMTLIPVVILAIVVVASVCVIEAVRWLI